MESTDLRGKFCPFPIIEVVQRVEVMESGECKVFLVDDPLAIRSIPEELEEFEYLDINIKKNNDYWEVIITNTEG
ncbi:MAG: sulfurtransferase TusA family protein [Candidatus Auribacter fodinae]|jgi:TusA-related sulfurtransferase|uniref:Sulfurtransferase TusA family protein n=1 Tax=Candidatus Auribacter fodinae TaxID=2093366 RepID=A0A3A4RBE0_9BACT|nr:MAG: sulfurtransferase TusA family protein [Candidatus Auribacter fodinae]